MKVISWDDVHRFGDYAAVIDAIATMYRTGCDVIERLDMSQPTSHGEVADCLIQPAWMRARALGIKIANVFPKNPERHSLPSVVGLYVLFDGNTGEPLACIDGVAETFIKTACNSAVASQLLSREDSRTLLMMGAGKLAPYLIEAHRAVRPLERVLIWNRNFEKAQELAERMNRKAKGHEAVAERPAAIQAADIVCCATYAEQPILQGQWLKDGAHVDLVGGYRPDQREADDDVALRAKRLYVDTRVTTVDVAGDAIDPIKKGLVQRDEVADLFEVAQGRAQGRRSATDITMFKSGGGGHEDLATALLIYQRSLAA